MSEPTTVVRLTAANWAALQALTKGGDATVEAVQLAAVFAQPFVEAPQVIGDATDLIRPWRDLIGRVGREGAVTVTITGPQASGKTLIATALEQTLATIRVPTHTVRLDGRHTRLSAAPNDYAVLIIDGQ